MLKCHINYISNHRDFFVELIAIKNKTSLYLEPFILLFLECLYDFEPFFQTIIRLITIFEEFQHHLLEVT